MFGRFSRLGRSHGSGDRDVAEPVAGTLHRRVLHRGLGFGLRCLHALPRAQIALHLTHHADGLGAAAAGFRGVRAGDDGEAKAVLGMRIGADDLGGEIGLEGIGGIQGDDRRHGGFLAVGAGFRGVGDRRWKETAQGGEDFAGNSGG